MQNPISWHDAVELVQPYVVRISTPGAMGTGFLVSRSTVSSYVALATAGHVVQHAHEWGEPIKIEHPSSGKAVLLREGDRIIEIEQKIDTATVIMDGQNLPFPSAPLALVPEGQAIKVGVEIGWLGFPAVSPGSLCFFSGRISATIGADRAYLVDGVAINGVSGGPAFHLVSNGLTLMGVVSAYIANRATGETLPGLAVVRDVLQCQQVVKKLKDADDFTRKQLATSQKPEGT